MSEANQFLKELEAQEKPVDPFAPEETVTEEVSQEQTDVEDPEEQPEEIKNRRHKRLEEKLRAEREANIALNERLKAIAEARGTESDTDYLKSIERIYGTDSAEAVAATELLKNALLGAKEAAKREALAEIQAERAREKEELAKSDEELDSMLEDLEDSYNVDLSSPSSPARKAFFTLLERMSPKDSEGNIIAYADHHAVWDVYQAQRKKPENPAKSLAARSLTQSASASTATADTSTEQFLKEHGII
jgi:hypothetical protein